MDIEVQKQPPPEWDEERYFVPKSENCEAAAWLWWDGRGDRGQWLTVTQLMLAGF